MQFNQESVDLEEDSRTVGNVLKSLRNRLHCDPRLRTLLKVTEECNIPPTISPPSKCVDDKLYLCPNSATTTSPVRDSSAESPSSHHHTLHHNTNTLCTLNPLQNTIALQNIHAATMELFAAQQTQIALADVIRVTERLLKPATLDKITTNYTNALDFLLKTLPTQLDVAYICGLHQIVASGVRFAGVLRHIAIESSYPLLFLPISKHATARDVLGAMLQELNAQILQPECEAVHLAAWLGHIIIKMHLFDDCNGRLARLMIQWVLRLRGLPFCISLCSPPLRQAYALAIRHSDSSKLAILIAEQVDAAWRRYFELTSSTLHQYCLSPSMSAKELCAAAMAKDTEEKQKASRCSLCNNEDASVMLWCCKFFIHVSCLAEWSRLSSMCPNCHSLINASDMLFDNIESPTEQQDTIKSRKRSRSGSNASSPSSDM